MKSCQQLQIKSLNTQHERQNAVKDMPIINTGSSETIEKHISSRRFTVLKHRSSLDSAPPWLIIKIDKENKANHRRMNKLLAYPFSDSDTTSSDSEIEMEQRMPKQKAPNAKLLLSKGIGVGIMVSSFSSRRFGFAKDDIEVALNELPDKNESCVVIYLMKKGYIDVYLFSSFGYCN